MSYPVFNLSLFDSVPRSCSLAMRFGLLVGALLLCSSCAVAPVTQGWSARPAGKGQLETGFQWSGYRNGQNVYAMVPMVRARYGLSERWSLSGQSELSSLAVNAEYAYWQNESKDLFLALVLPSAYVGGQFSFGIGQTASALWGKWEPFLGALLYIAHVDSGRVDTAFFTAPPPLQGLVLALSFGTRYWLLDTLALGFHLNALASPSGYHFTAPLLQSFSVGILL